MVGRHVGRALPGFGYVKPGSDAASDDVHDIVGFSPGGATANDAEAKAVVFAHGSFVTPLVTHNS